MRKIISFLLILASLFCLLTSCDTNEKPTYYHTEDVADFNKGIYSLEGYACFNYGVPAEAEVISFYYHEENYNCVFDISWEMKFETVEDLKLFVEHIKSTAREKYETDLRDPKNELIHEEQNPYDPDFIDLFVPDVALNGYKNKERHDHLSRFVGKKAYSMDVDIACFSYSYNDLTVIAFSSYNPISHSADPSFRMLPRYLIYFNVPLTEEYQRVFKLR